MDAHQKLVLLTMRVFPANLGRGHIKDQEIALHLERKVFGSGEKTAQIPHQRQAVDGGSVDPRGEPAGFGGDLGRASRFDGGDADVAGDPGGITGDDGVGGNVERDHGTA